MTADAARERDNPFSSRFVRPGAIPYLFTAGTSASQLVDKFCGAGRRGQLVGPHGAGKSTLLALLMKEFAARGEVVTHFELHDGQRALNDPIEIAPGSVICVDGYEQLSYWSRYALARRASREGCGLLITSHRVVWFPAKLPVLAEVRPSVAVAVNLALSLLKQHGGASNAGGIGPAEIERIFFEVGGDLRELFFRLYDLYESQRS